MSSHGAVLAILLALAARAPAAAQAPVDDPSLLLADEEEEVEEGLRQRLTEREDKRRPPVPWSTVVFGRRLAVGGEYELEVGLEQPGVGDEPGDQNDRLWMAHGLEVEAFYRVARKLSAFVQAEWIWEEDLLSRSAEQLSGAFVERGEMWLYWEDLADLGLHLDVGRLDFEDERRWWWDDEIDGVRLELERDEWDVSVAFVRELFSRRSDQTWVEPEHERVARVIVEAGWEVAEDHQLEAFALLQRDHSHTEHPGERVREEREDEFDADLLWLGARAMGVTHVGPAGHLGYWLDAGWVDGDERVVGFEDVAGGEELVAESVERFDVRGWALDVGVNWMPPLRVEPRLFVGYAIGSGDDSPGSGRDRSYRQTQLQANEAGFGGVERFGHYGLLLEPELSNLGVLTVGAGIALGRSSSLDLVWHHHRLVELADELRDARYDAELTGRSRDVGQEIDLVLALEEWERFECELTLAGFRAGHAFGAERGDWSFGAFAAVRWAF
jgi:hypothetical protein